MKNSFVLYTTQRKILDKLDMRQRGELLTALMAYVAGEDPPVLDEKTDVAFSAIQIQIDMDTAKFEKVVEKRAAAGRASAAARKARKKAENSTYVDFVQHNEDVDEDEDVNEDVDVSKDKETGARAPTVEEIRSYAASIGYDSLDAQGFADYYKARGWVVSGESVKDWQALVRRWQARETKKPETKPNRFHNFNQRSEDLDAEMFARIKRQREA